MMDQSEDILLENIEIPVPVLTIDAWTEAAPEGGEVEKGVTIRWELPAGVDAMMVEVDGASWGPYLDPVKTLNIGYTEDQDRRLNEDPVRVKLRYLKFGEALELNVLPIGDIITLILDDVVIMRTGQNSTKAEFCPANKYPTALTPFFSTFNYWEIKYSDKYSSNGAYRAVRINITKDGTTVSCVIRPDAADAAKDAMFTPEFCGTDLQGNFTEQENGGQKFVETTDFTGHTVGIKSYRDTDQDEVVVRIHGIDNTFTVGARLHENS